MLIVNLKPEEKYPTLAMLCENVKSKFEDNKETGNKAEFTEETIFRIDLDKNYIEVGKNSITQGIELLKWLRVSNINNHVVLTSFFSFAEFLKKNPKNAIVGSKGTTFVQLPNERLINKNEYIFKKDKLGSEIMPEASSSEDLKAVFRIDFDLKKIRHEEANIWGLNRLWQTHKKIFPETFIQIEKELSKNDSLTFHLYEYIFTSERNNTFELTDDAVKEIKDKIEAIRLFNPKVIYIDDKADIGWANLLNEIIYGGKADPNTFCVIIPNALDNKDTLKSKIELLCVNRDIKLVILDLRLFDYEKHISDYKNLESHRLLKEIRSEQDEQLNLKYYWLKFMVFTASNNLSVYKSMVNNSAFAPHHLFVKEGIDLMFSEQESFENYSNLINAFSVFFNLRPQNKTDILQRYDIKMYELADSFLKHLKLIDPNKQYNLKNLESFDCLIFDTNIFMRNTSYFEEFEVLTKILVHLKDKIFIHYTVLYELEQNSYPRGASKSTVQCEYFLDLIISNNIPINYQSLPDNYRNLFDSSKDNNDLADFYLVDLCEKLLKDNKKVLFLSNDWKGELSDSAGKITRHAGPAFYLYKLKKDMNIRNLQLLYKGHLLKDYINADFSRRY